MRASSASSEAASGARLDRTGRALIAAVGLAGTLLPLNSTMLAVALPDIASDVGGGVAASSWLVTAYVVAMAALGPLAGRLGDRHGRRRMIVLGLVLFGAASAAAGAAPSLPLLVVARVLQAAAGSLVVPNAMAVLRSELPAARRAAAFGLVGSVLGVAAAAGPALGGVLVDVTGWRGVFLVNLPVVVAALVLTLRVVPADRAAADGPGAHAARGALRRVVGREFAAATGAVALSNLAMYATLLAIPVVLSGRAGWSAGDAGLALAVMSAVMVAVSPLAGRLADRRGRRGPAAVGLVALSAAMAELGATGADPGTAGIIAAMIVAGAGLGLAGAPLQAAAVEAVQSRDAGVASGLFSTGRYLGSIGAALLLAVVLGDTGDGAGTLFALAALASGAAALLTVAMARPGASGSLSQGISLAPRTSDG